MCDHGLRMKAVYKSPRPGVVPPTIWEYEARSPLINGGLTTERSFNCEPSSVKSLRASLGAVSSSSELRAVNAYIKDLPDDMFALKCHIPSIEQFNISDGYHYLVKPSDNDYLNTTIVAGSIADSFFLEKT